MATAASAEEGRGKMNKLFEFVDRFVSAAWDFIKEWVVYVVVCLSIGVPLGIFIATRIEGYFLSF